MIRQWKAKGKAVKRQRKAKGQAVKRQRHLGLLERDCQRGDGVVVRAA